MGRDKNEIDELDADEGHHDAAKPIDQEVPAKDGRGAQDVIRDSLEWSLKYVSQTLIQFEAGSSGP